MSDSDPKWYLRYDGRPPIDDDNDYRWDKIARRWVIVDDYDEPEIDEDAVERAERRRIKRIEWDTYHPGVPCPKSELGD